MANFVISSFFIYVGEREIASYAIRMAEYLKYLIQHNQFYENTINMVLLYNEAIHRSKKDRPCTK